MTLRSLEMLALVVCLAQTGLSMGQRVSEAVDGASQPVVVANASGDAGAGPADRLGQTSDSDSKSNSDADADSAGRPPVLASRSARRTDFNSDVYYANKVEFSLESGMLWINLPFVFDAFVGGDYALSSEHYTLVPVFPSVRWQLGEVRGPWFLRGNTDMTFTWSVTAIPRGPENLYDAFDLGFRRNFVQRNWRVAPYFEVRVGAGFLNAQEPYGNGYSQGQDLTFTMMVGSGFRYNFNGCYSMAIGTTYFHVSNAYLSEPKYDDNGINVVGPLLGFNVRLSKPRE